MGFNSGFKGLKNNFGTSLFITGEATEEDNG